MSTRNSPTKVAKRLADPRRLEQRPNVWHNLIELQTLVRQKLYSDPTVTQSSTFTFLAPLLIFICAFTLGVMVPRHPHLKTKAVDALNGDVSVLVKALILVALWVATELVVLRAFIWVAAKLATAFCEWDLKRVSDSTATGSIEDEDTGKEFKLTSANIIAGRLLGE